MSLLLRLAAAIDRRPEPVVMSLSVDASQHQLRIELVPDRSNRDLSLEQWSLESCAETVQAASGVELSVSVQG
jgi:exopolyphosphatase/guanosine-5'-triphosphate,3'-diphosphate pyrophosphatase